MRIARLIGAMSAVALLGTACGSAGGSNFEVTDTKVDVGEGLSVPVAKNHHIAFFEFSTNNEYQLAYGNKLKEVAEEAGIELTVFDANLDPATQLNQMQNALQSGKYDTWIVEPVDGNIVCDIVSKQAPKAGIIVSVQVVPICGRDAEHWGEDVWQPGTLNTVGGENTVDFFTGFVNGVVDRLEGSHKIALVTGPKLNSLARNLEKSLEQKLADRPDLEVVATARTDFTTPDALTKSQDLLLAHPEVDTVISVFSAISQGVLQAVKESGREGAVKVYDIGANKWAVQAVRDGMLAATVPYTPESTAEKGFQSIQDAWAGKTPERFVDAAPPFGTVTEPYLVDSSNAHDFEPQF